VRRVAGWVQRRLQFDVERSCAHAAAIHRAQHLDVANGVETKPLGDAGLHQFDDPRHGGLRIVCVHEIEVAVALRLSEIGDRSLVNPMGSCDDAALRGLPENLGQADHRHGA
jgi:hypothetical protein